MAYYAFLNDDNVVTEVLPGKDETELLDGLPPEQWYAQYRGQRCLRTSFNARIRGRFAGVGYTYDDARDVFIEPQPFPSWTLNNATTEWEPPTPRPVIAGDWLWIEALHRWMNAAN